MILISRKKNESIVLRDDIILTVIEIRGDKVRLGVEHPRESQFTGREVYKAICRCSKGAHGDAIRPKDSHRQSGSKMGFHALSGPSCRIDLSEAPIESLDEQGNGAPYLARGTDYSCYLSIGDPLRDQSAPSGSARLSRCDLTGVRRCPSKGRSAWQPMPVRSMPRHSPLPRQAH